MEARVLRLNLAGQPLEWIDWQSVVCLYARELVRWSLGGVVRNIYGGYSRLNGCRSHIKVPAIVACGGGRLAPVRNIPALSNTALFCRDNYQCLYCGRYFSRPDLSRDHVIPRSRGGQDRWENVVAACKRCNQHKGNWLLEEIDMELIALPYRPNAAEYLAMINGSRIRPDQAEYLRPLFANLNHM
ncbi:HNH endonuclease [Pseudomaricurvus alkylphenolicus]|uniref:HNH endonuclease n=1 Tax=Pseudomaricurvus alkylphenolicus TaxID=1306991 RepID=UPI0014242606|nr:HNH endonuclease [Pseudomaricurvus alkylphenolicus]NIB39125.1 HNH endonuclease [Pseudomaricurvus alkylphenolicus]